jgi:hypothetical protein
MSEIGLFVGRSRMRRTVACISLSEHVYQDVSPVLLMPRKKGGEGIPPPPSNEVMAEVAFGIIGNPTARPLRRSSRRASKAAVLSERLVG